MRNQHDTRAALTPEEASAWIDTLRVIYDEGYLSAQKFEELKRGILGRVQRPRGRQAA